MRKLALSICALALLGCNGAAVSDAPVQNGDDQTDGVSAFDADASRMDDLADYDVTVVEGSGDGDDSTAVDDAPADAGLDSGDRDVSTMEDLTDTGVTSVDESRDGDDSMAVDDALADAGLDSGDGDASTVDALPDTGVTSADSRGDGPETTAVDVAATDAGFDSGDVQVAPVDADSEAVEVDTGSGEAGSDAIDAQESGLDGDSSIADTSTGDSGTVPHLPGETAYPWTTNHCRVWTESPWVGTVAASNDEGVWMIDEFNAVVSRGTPSGWYLSQFPATMISSLVGNAGWLCAVDWGGGLYYHVAGGGWSRLSGVPYAAPTTAVWADGNDLFIVASDTETVFEFNGTAWTPLRRTTTTASGTALADGTDGELFLYNRNGLHHYVGGSWSDITLPTTTTLTALTFDGPGRVLIGAGMAVYSWDGSIWHSVTEPCAPTYAPSLTRLPSGTYGEFSCGTSLLERWTAAAQTWTQIGPAFPPGVPIQDPSGGVDNFDANSGIMRLSGGVWTRWQDQVAPTSFRPNDDSTIVSTDGSNFFIAAHDGVAQLVGDSWQTLAGSGGSVMTEYVSEAPDGSLFQIQADLLSGSGALLHSQAGVWTSDYSFSYMPALTTPFSITNIAARSGTDAYASMEGHVFHWNGSSWTDMHFVPPSGSATVSSALGVGTAPWVFPTVGTWSGTGTTSFQWDGGSMYDLPGPVVGNGLDPSHAFVFVENGGHIVAIDGTGWSSVGAPVPTYGFGITGTDASHLAAVVDMTTLEHFNGGPSWTTVADWGVGLIQPHSVGWTDGRNVAIATGRGVAICDLGP